MKKKFTILAATALIAALTVGTIVWAMPVSQTTVLGGDVVKVVSVGQNVKEGDAIMYVETIGGPMVAARASDEGKIVKVTVTPGTAVEVGQVVAVIDNGK